MSAPTTSTVPVVKTTIVSALSARLTADNVLGDDGTVPTVYYSHPGQELGMDGVWLGNTKRGSSTIPTMRAGRKHREEEYVVEVVFEPCRVGPSASPAESAAFAQLAALENLLAEDPGVGLHASLTPTLLAVLRGWATTCTWDAGTGGWRCRLVADVAVRSRLA